MQDFSLHFLRISWTGTADNPIASSVAHQGDTTRRELEHILRHLENLLSYLKNWSLVLTEATLFLLLTTPLLLTMISKEDIKLVSHLEVGYKLEHLHLLGQVTN